MSETQSARSFAAKRDRAQRPVSPALRAVRRVPRRHQAALVLADAGLAELFFLATVRIEHTFGLPAGSGDGRLALVLGILFPLIVASRGLYRLGRFPSWRGQAAAGLRAVAWSVGISIAALFLFAREIPFGARLILVSYHAMLAVWMVALRPLLAVWLRRRVEARLALPDRVLLVGSDRAALDTARRLARRGRGIELLGFADFDRPVAAGIDPFYATTLDTLPVLAGELEADLVLLARPDLPREDVVRVSDRLVGNGIQVRIASNAVNRLIDSLPMETYGGVSLVPVGQTPLNGRRERIKRAFDIVAVCVGGLIVLPLLLLLTFLVMVSSPGPVLYRQIRIGRQGRPFVFYKFRSMRVANDDSEHRRYVRDLVENGGAAATDGSGRKIYKLVDDSRVTWIGRFLRRTSLDELPQLINVLRGEMSLVGPRPGLPFEYELYREWQKRRLEVTPGMTGLWQVTGRSYVTFEDMVLLDLFYIANWSLLMDLKLLLKTVPVVVFGKGGL